jgi:mono/diheme cytochrome c family protein
MLSLFLAIFIPIASLGHFSENRASHSPAIAENTTSVHAGEQIFLQKCFQCHSVIKGQNSFGPNLNGLMKKPHARMNDTEIRGILVNGKGKMPSFQNRLTKQDTDNLLAYLHTL